MPVRPQQNSNAEGNLRGAHGRSIWTHAHGPDHDVQNSVPQPSTIPSRIALNSQVSCEDLRGVERRATRFAPRAPFDPFHGRSADTRNIGTSCSRNSEVRPRLDHSATSSRYAQKSKEESRRLRETLLALDAACLRLYRRASSAT